MQNSSIRDELNVTLEELENESKNYEDLEFQHLEEEVEWSSYHEELQHDLNTLTTMVAEKTKYLATLETQGVDNQRTACMDTHVLNADISKLKSDLAEMQAHLRQIDREIMERTGKADVQHSESADDENCGPETPHTKMETNPIEHMSQSLFGSHEDLRTKSKFANAMTQSVNENMFYENKIESRTPYSSTAIRELSRHAMNTDDNSITMLKYNLSPPFQHTMSTTPETTDEVYRRAQLNLSIESDDFEVNPLEKRVPSQDDIDRICKVTFDAPISMQGASFKVIESIKEIERNRQLLLAQQGA